MGHAETIWSGGTIVITPDGRGAAVSDGGGSPIASCDAGGTISDAASNAIASANLLDQGRRPKPGGVGLVVSSPSGGKLGEARVAKYRIGPKARRATLAISDGQGGEAGRLEPRDKRGAELELTAAGSVITTVTMEQVKSGFMRKTRVYTASLMGDPGQNAALFLAVLVRFDAALSAVVDAVGSERHLNHDF